MNQAEEIELVKKTRQRQIYIPRERAGEWVRMRHALGPGIGCRIMDMYREWKAMKKKDE